MKKVTLICCKKVNSSSILKSENKSNTLLRRSALLIARTTAMKILMLGWELPPHNSGGLGVACYHMSKALAQAGATIDFVLPYDAYHPDTEFMTIHAATRLNPIHKFGLLGAYDSKMVDEIDLDKVDLKDLETMRGVQKRYIKFVERLVKTIDKPDAIHAHDWLTYPAGIAAKYVSGKPLVVHMHATEFDRSGENINKNVYDIERKGMEEADRVITVSNLTRNIVIERYGIDPNKVITVHNAVEPVERTESHETQKHVKEKVVTFLGRVTFQKGPEYFVEAARKVLNKDPDVRFVMAGTGDLLEKMIRRVAKLHMATRFHFTGFLKGDNVDKMFAMSDVYVMPSVSEPFGISPLEAMRSNVPVVISKQSGVAEVLNHALKVDFWDIDALADAIYGLLHYKSLSSMFAKHGEEEVNNLKWDNAASNVRDVYQQVV